MLEGMASDISERIGCGSGVGSLSRSLALRAASCCAALRSAYTRPPNRPRTVEKAIPKTPQLNTNRKRALSPTLIRFDQMPAHIVDRVSWCALTIESGMIDQKAVKADPPMSTLP